MKPVLSLLLIVELLCPIFLAAQETNTFPKEKILEDIAESLGEGLDENTDLSGILDELEEMALHPININTATSEELQHLRFLSPAQIESLLRYRKRVGQLYTLNELQLIDGFNKELAERLSLFITIAPPEARLFRYWKHELNLRSQYTFEKAAGFIADENGEKRFAGIEPKLYLKYKGEKDGRWTWGLTAENDAGEAFFTGNNPAGFDFYSGHLAWGGKKIVRKVIAGDFQVKTGQGLLFWSGYGGRKMTDGYSLRYIGQGLRPYSSSTEYGFYRGIACELEPGKFNIMAFYSNRNADANVSAENEEGDADEVSSLQEMGYHRTANEIADKGSLNMQTAGLSARYTQQQFTAALNGGYQHYALAMNPDTQLYNQYYFRGKDNFCISTDVQKATKVGVLFGEIALSRSGGSAMVAGIDASPSSEIGFSILFRDYKKDFHTIGGNPFSELGYAMNERGIYSGINLFSIPGMTLNAYLDLYETYWTKYTSLRPVKGNDFALQANYTLTKKITLQLKFKTETRNENSMVQTPVKTDADETTRRIRLNGEWQPTEQLRIRIRTEWNGISKEDSMIQGWLLLADATTQLFDERLSATARVAWFDTDHYNSGIRAYENDLPQSFNFPVYYQNGIRYYINLAFRLSKSVFFYLKFAQTRLSDDFTSIGSGDLEIMGNHKTELKFQVRFKF